MEFLKSSKRRSVFSELLYILLNVALALAVLAVVWAVNSPLPALGLVLLSKWRVLAVRPRYWFANIQANLVDIIVSISVVVLLHAAAGALVAQGVITALYIVWLLVIKPRSKRAFVAVQAGTAIFLGVSALAMVSYEWNSALVVLAMWLIGYSAARHVLGGYDDPHMSFYALVWGLVFAELGWITYHWTFAYALPGVGDIKLSQTALIAVALSFLTERAYTSYSHHGSVRSSDIVLPALLSASIIVVLLLFFNNLGPSTV
jgi:hypothetical protein